MSMSKPPRRVSLHLHTCKSLPIAFSRRQIFEPPSLGPPSLGSVLVRRPRSIFPSLSTLPRRSLGTAPAPGSAGPRPRTRRARARAQMAPTPLVPGVVSTWVAGVACRSDARTLASVRHARAAGRSGGRVSAYAGRACAPAPARRARTLRHARPPVRGPRQRSARTTPVLPAWACRASQRRRPPLLWYHA